MMGVTTYAFSRPQKSYLGDFEEVVAASLTHPYTSITSFNVGSVPHNLITGTAYPESMKKGNEASTSEYKRSYNKQSYIESFNTRSNGLRSEEFAFVG